MNMAAFRMKMAFALVFLLGLCATIEGRAAPITFSGGKSGVGLTTDEMEIYSYKIPSGYLFGPDEVRVMQNSSCAELTFSQHAAITHFWITGANRTFVDNATIRFGWLF